ncbi:metal-dependent hydrolase [Campylobacter sp. W0014]|uniref:metal-dependent hydrolase n=1 Tax=Campylobacter sp. W0014 TaxID=2735781 RepID=UPI001ED138E6|nr:metal-dependent hydrolase [Campylobacter sp. W0014]
MLIKNAKIYGQELQDVLVQNGKISKIGTQLEGDEILDAKEMTLLPSFVDLGVSLKDDKFSLDHLSFLEQECIENGFSAVVLRDCMDFDEEIFSLFLQNLNSKKIKIFPNVRVLDAHGKIKNLATFLNKKANALELKSSSDTNILRVVMQYALMKDSFVFTHCNNSDFDDRGVMNDCKTSFNLGLMGMSSVAETSEVAKIKEIAQFYGVKVVFDLLSLKRSIEILDDNDLKLVSIHHLIKDDSACENFNTAAKLNPPLRSIQDKESLRTFLKEGKIQFLTSMHSPKSSSLKDLAFDEAAFGIDGISDFISLCYTFFIKNGFLTWKELCNFTSRNPSEFLGLNAGAIEVGKDANLILVNENEEISTPKSPLYNNDKLFAKVKKHIIKGVMI